MDHLQMTLTVDDGRNIIEKIVIFIVEFLYGRTKREIFHHIFCMKFVINSTSTNRKFVF